VSFVLDNSVAMRWLLAADKPKDAAYAAKALDSLKQAQAIVPSLWPLEVANVVVKVESKGLMTEARTQAFIALLGRLNIVVDNATAAQALGETLGLARRHKLSAYDAAYLELALRTGLPLATLDDELAKSARKSGVRLFNAL
jgi:predicted nucleic acid-binding protein